jgi:hypothetical protein
MHFQKKGRANGRNKRIIKRLDLKHLPFGRGPTNFILTIASQLERVQNNKEQGNQLHLLFIHLSNEGDIPL